MEKQNVQKIVSYLKFRNIPLLKKLRGNALTVAGISVISVITLVSLLGYVISPDASPNANRQLLELAAKNPGFSCTFIKVQRNETVEEVGFFRKMMQGEKDECTFIPVDTFYISQQYVHYSVYDNEQLKTDVERVELLSALFPIHKNKTVYTTDSVFFHHETVGFQKESLEQLKNRFYNNHVVTKTFLLGTDRFGRDLLSRMIIGARISLSVGLVSVLISLVIGLVLGLVSGYYMGLTDKVVMFFVNVIWSVPALLMALALSMIMKEGYWQLFLAIGLTMWVEVARIVRGQVISVREKDYIVAARVLGFSNIRIIFKHVLPNIINPVIIICAANFSTAILLEAGLSFLGIGIQPPMPSWGGIIRDHYGFIIVDQAFLAVVPGIAIVLLVLSFTFVGNGLRDALDNKS